MAIEIERKFLVDHSLWTNLSKPAPLYCSQTYLLKEVEKTIRIRILGDCGFITIKTKRNHISRNEFEYKIPLEEARELISLSDEVPIEKNRYLLTDNGFTWEVDVFEDLNKGLIIAEIELDSEDQEFDKPEWLLDEVSDDPRFYNSNLQQVPFSKW